MAIISGIGTAISTLVLGTFLFYRPDGDEPIDAWFPIASILFYIFINTFGFFVLPGIMLSEMLPARARGVLGGLTFTVINISLFITAKVYPQFIDAFHGYGMFWFFGAASIIGTVFIYFFVPETKGKPLAEIEDYFAEDNILWTRRERKKTEQNLALTQC